MGKSQAKRAEIRRKDEFAKRQRKCSRLGVDSLPIKPKHTSKKRQG